MLHRDLFVPLSLSDALLLAYVCYLILLTSLHSGASFIAHVSNTPDVAHPQRAPICARLNQTQVPPCRLRLLHPVWALLNLQLEHPTLQETLGCRERLSSCSQFSMASTSSSDNQGQPFNVMQAQMQAQLAQSTEWTQRQDARAQEIFRALAPLGARTLSLETGSCSTSEIKSNISSNHWPLLESARSSAPSSDATSFRRSAPASIPCGRDDGYFRQFRCEQCR